MTVDESFAEWVTARLKALADGRCDVDPAEALDPAQAEIAALLAKIEAKHVADRAQLLDTQRFLDSIVENIPHMIFVKDAAELRFVRFNRAGEALLGYDRADLIGKNDYDFFPTDEADFFTSKDRSVLDGGSMLDIPEEPIHTRAGARWLHTKKIPIAGDDGAPAFLLGISEDITAKKQAAEVLSQRTRQLERSNDALQRFAYVASHDLQEPLRTVASYIQLLEREYATELDEEARKYISFVVDAARRMKDLIRGLLSLSRVSTSGEALALAELGEVLAQVQSDLALRIEECGASVSIGLLPVLWIDREQMRQLFGNLIGNALKFVAKGTTPQVRVSAERVDDLWRLYVDDNGIGVESGFAEQVFEVFKRLHSQSVYPGTGIGLAICQRIVDRHGGRIWVEDRDGGGARFCVELPAGRPGSDPPPAP